VAPFTGSDVSWVTRCGSIGTRQFARRRHTDGDLAVGGAGLAASLLDLIDEFRPTVVPAFVGGGKPYVPLGADLRLRLLEQRTFSSGTVYLRYERIR
jgi:dihydrofolate reductase